MSVKQCFHEAYKIIGGGAVSPVKSTGLDVAFLITDPVLGLLHTVGANTTEQTRSGPVLTERTHMNECEVSLSYSLHRRVRGTMTSGKGPI